MGISFDISSNFDSIQEYLSDIKYKAVFQGARSAINKTLVTARKESVRIIAEHYKTGSGNKLTKKDIRQDMKIIRAKGNTASTLIGELFYSGDTIPILKFIKGSQEIIQQKGIKVKKRRKLRAEIVRGKVIKMPKAFIQKKNTTQVFKGRRGQGFKRQGVAGIGIVMMRPAQSKKILDVVAQRFPDLFAHEVQFRLNKLSERTSRQSMKKL